MIMLATLLGFFGVANTVTLVWALRSRARAAAQRAKLEGDVAGLQIDAEGLRSQVPDAIDDLRALHETRALNLSSLNAQLTAELEVVQRKADGYFAEIDGACKQRDFWQGWYYRQAREHANAQAYLMRVIQGLMLQVSRATGKTPTLDKTLRSIVTDFDATHPALADSGQRADSPAPADQSATGPDVG